MKLYSIRRVGTKLCSITAMLMVVLFGSSCKDHLDEYYERPDWIKGNIYEVLHEEGNYETFLKAVDLSGYKRLINGKGILTVMAPNDSAFEVYLKGKGLNSIEEVDSVELKKLVGFHVLYYAFNTEKLINFRPQEGDDASDDEKKINAGLYYKHRTKSQDSITLEWDKVRAKYLQVYHQERFLPVFSYKMFETKQIDAAYNYEYFFPNTMWQGANGFNVSNAAVEEYELISSNGYIYKVDQVLRPLETIYTELHSRPEYSQFLEMYNKYEYYAEEEALTQEYGNGEKVYQHYHVDPMANIACEWPVIDYSKMTELSYVAYSIFAPSNTAISGFFNDYWKIGGYDSLSEVSNESMNYLLYNCVYSKSLVFPEEIKKGLIENSYGSIISFDVDNVPQANRIMCENGVFYGCETLDPPAMFRSITGPAFQYKKYSYYLKMLDASGMTTTFSSDQTRYLALMPSNTQMNSAGITVNRDDQLIRNNSVVGNNVKSNYVYTHVVDLGSTPGSYTEIPMTGTAVFPTLSPTYHIYWYVVDGKLTNTIKHNEKIFPDAKTDDENIFVPLTELTFRGEEWSNGRAYAYDTMLFEGSFDLSRYKSFQAMMYNNLVDESLPYQGFAQLLVKAGLYTSQTYNFTLEDCLVFVPTTQAVRDALQANRIPGITYSDSLAAIEPSFFDWYAVTDQDTLQTYLKRYFVPLSTAGLSNFPYVGWNETTPVGGIATADSKEWVDENNKAVVETTMMGIIDDGSKLTVRLMMKNEAPVDVDVAGDYHYFPFVFEDGCVQFLTKCF